MNCCATTRLLFYCMGSTHLGVTNHTNLHLIAMPPQLSCLCSAFLIVLAGFWSPSTAQIVINEVDYDQSGTDAAEYVELYNAGLSGVNLSGYSLELVNGSGPSVYDTINLPGITLAAGDYFVVCANAATVDNCDLDDSPNTNFIQNGAPDAIGLRDNGILIDAVSYEGNVVGYTEGSGVGLVDNPATDFAGISRFPDGTDTGVNNVDFTARCSSPGEANLAATSNCLPPDVVINEIDADQSGTDAAEFVELFGEPNLSLNGLVLVLFNGTGDVSYNAFDLDGQSLDSDGFFVICGDAANVANCDLDVSPNTNLIQNGPDAAALYQADASDFPNGTAITTTDLLDAIVYDTDDADDAGLLVLLNAGQPQVDEGANGNSAGESSSRLPDGGAFRDTDTYVQQAPTPGVTNVIPSGGPNTILINEVDYDQPGNDEAEYVELYNFGTDPVSLIGYTLELVNGNGNSVYDSIVLPNVDLVAGDYFVICANAATVPDCDLDDGPNTNFLQNGAPDAVGLRRDGSLVDAVSYEGDVTGYTESSGFGLSDSSGDDFISISRLPDGTDTDVNNVDFSRRCATPGEENVVESADCPDPAFVPNIVINEIDADTPGSDAAEFIELYGDPGLPLDGFSLVFFNGSGDVSYRAYDLDGQTLDGLGFFVLCANAATVDNCDLDVSPNTNLIQNGADAVGLYEADASDFPDGTVVTTSGLIDAIVYDTDDSDDAGLLVLLNAGQPQVDERGGGSGTTHSNSRVPDGGTARNTDTYTQQPPTPGFFNVPPPVAEIFAIQSAGLTSPFDSMVVTTEDNVVTALRTDGFFIQTPDARSDGDPNTSDGIFVFEDAVPSVSVGDVVDVTGLVVEFFDFTEFAAGALVAVKSTGASLPAPIVFDGSTPSPTTTPSCAIEFECYESMLLTVTGGSVGSGNQSFGSDPIAENFIVAGSPRAFREPGIVAPGLPRTSGLGWQPGSI